MNMVRSEYPYVNSYMLSLINMSLLSKKERVEGAILGLLIGDALGVPYEFHKKETIPPLKYIENNPPENFE